MKCSVKRRFSCCFALAMVALCWWLNLRRRELLRWLFATREGVFTPVRTGRGLLARSATSPLRNLRSSQGRGGE